MSLRARDRSRSGNFISVLKNALLLNILAPLIKDSLLTRGGGLATFARATTKTCIDFEGVMKTSLAGEICEVGARRVANLWGIQSATLAIAASNTMTLAAGTYVFSMGAGTGTATFSGTGGATGTLTANATNRTSVSKTITAGTLVVTGSVAILVDLQVEYTTGQANQNPSEYVSNGVLVAPYHGAGIDGVKYFSSTNGNTVISNVVIENQGTSISNSILRGINIDELRTNSIRCSSWADPTNGAIAAAGVELITNSLLTVDMVGWTDKSTGGGTATWVAGSIALSSGAGSAIVETSFAVTAGVVYTLQFTHETANLTTARIGTASGLADVFTSAIGVVGKRYYSFTPAATGTVFLQFVNSTAATTANLYVISCRQQALPLLYRAASALSIATSRSIFTVSAVGTVKGIQYADVRIQIPVTGSSSAPLFAFFESVTNIVAATGETWDTSIYLARVGTSNNVISLCLTLGERTAAGAAVLNHIGNNILANLTTELQKFDYSALFTGGGTVARVVPGIRLTFTAGVIADITLRIGFPQCEKASYASSTIPTTTVAITRNADVLSIPTIGVIGTTGSVYLEFTPSGSSGGLVYLWGSYTDINNHTQIYHDGTNFVMHKSVAGVTYNATIALAFSSGNTYKIVARFGSSGQQIYVNGKPGISNSDISAAIIAATMQIGTDGNGVGQPGGTIKNFNSSISAWTDQQLWAYSL